MMMRTMRENTKIILWVVVIAFVVTIFAVWGLDLRTGSPSIDPNIIGKVNGVTLTQTQYRSVYEALANQFRASSPTQSLTYSQEQFVAEQAWENLVMSVVTDQEIQKLGIGVSNEEIVSFLRDSPPPEIQQYFVDEQGTFNNEAYQAALNNPEIDWTNLEQLARERIPRLKLQSYLASQVYVSEDEVVNSFQAESVEMTLKYVSYPIDTINVDDYTPTDDDFKQYYNSHQDQFTEPPKARVDLVQIAFEPSPADLYEAQDLAGWVRNRAVHGEEFGALVDTYSSAPTSSVEGSTGFLKRGQRDDAYFNALDSVEPDSITQPVAVEDGYYVIKLIEKRAVEQAAKDNAEPVYEYNAREILIEAKPSRQTIDSLYTLASDLRDRAEAIGLEEAAAEKQLEFLTPDEFTENSPIAGVGFVPAITRFAFANEVGTIGPVLRDENHLYVVRVVDRIPETVQPAADVNELIRQMLIREKKKELAHREATAFYQKANTGSFDEAVATYQVEPAEAGPVRVVDNLGNFGPNSTVAQAAVLAEQGEICPPIECRGSYVVVQVKERSQFDQAGFNAQSQMLYDRLLSQKVQRFMAYWYDKLKSESIIEDYRGRVSG